MLTHGSMSGNAMFRGLLCITALALLIATIGTVHGETYIVDDDWEGADFQTLSWALYNVNASDTIRVHSGHWWSTDLWIGTPIEIIGNGSSETKISFQAHDNIRINAENVSISDMTFEWEDDSRGYYLIRIQDSAFSIEDCTLLNGSIGMEVYDDIHDIFIQNITIRNAPYTAISTLGYSYITDCTVDGAITGIYVDGTSIIENLTLTNCSEQAVVIEGLASLTDCHLIGSGISVNNDRSLEHLILENTTVNDGPIDRIFNESHMMLSGDVGQYLVGNSENITIVGGDDTITTIVAYGCDDLSIIDTRIECDTTGVLLYNCLNITFTNVTIETGSEDVLASYCQNLKAVNSSFRSTGGIDLTYALNVTLVDCEIRGGLDFNWDPAFINNYSIINCTTGNGRYLFLAGEEDVTFDDVGELVAIDCNNISIRDSTLLEGNGLRFYESSNISITNVTCTETQYGIKAEACVDVTIESCTFENCADGLWIYESEDFIIKDVLIRNMSTYPYQDYYYYYHYGLYIYSSNNISLSNCTSVLAAIRMYYNDEVRIADSTFNMTGIYSGVTLHIGDNGSILNLTYIGIYISILANDAFISFDYSLGESGASYLSNRISITGDGNEITDLDAIEQTDLGFVVRGDGNLIDGMTITQMYDSFDLDGDDNTLRNIIVNGTGHVEIDGNNTEIDRCSFTNRSIFLISGDTFMINCTIDATEGVVLDHGTMRFTDCAISGNVYVERYGLHDYLSTEFIDCTIDGKMPTIIMNEEDPAIPADLLQLFLINCSDVVLSNRTIETFLNGIVIVDCSNVSIVNLTLIGRDQITLPYPSMHSFFPGGLTLDHCSNVGIYDSWITSYVQGIVIDHCVEIEIASVNISDNDDGIRIISSENINITRSVIFENTDTGITMEQGSTGNVFFNDLIGNLDDADETSSCDVYWWNNHWSHWRTDKNDDGIVDSPYFLRTDVYDYSPLARSFTTYEEPPGDTDDAPSIEIDERTSNRVYYGNTFIIIINVTDDRGLLERIELRVDGGNWTPVQPDESRISFTEFKFTIHLWADDYTKGTHTFEVRVTDGVHDSEIVEQRISIENPITVDNDGPLAIDSAFILQNTVLFLMALIFVFLIKRSARRKKGTIGKRKASPPISEDVVRPISPRAGRKPGRPVKNIKNSSAGKPKKPPRKTTSTRK